MYIQVIYNESADERLMKIYQQYLTPIQHLLLLLLLLLVRVMLTMCNMQESYTILKNSKMY
jgi:hypothetical protein